MAAPVINTTQSVLGYLQWQHFAFQPYATNSPTAWNTTPLPPGVELNAGTGRIAGASTLPGVFVFSLVAINADGSSDPIVFTLGIEPSAHVQPSGVIEVFVDLLTHQVSLNPQSFNSSGSGAAGPLFWTKRGDNLLIHLTFVKGGAVADLEITALKFALKELEPESLLVLSDQWRKIGQGEHAAYRVHAKLDTPALASALNNYETDDGTAFHALAEFEWVEANNLQPKVGPDFLRTTSRTFLVEVSRDLIPED